MSNTGNSAVFAEDCGSLSSTLVVTGELCCPTNGHAPVMSADREQFIARPPLVHATKKDDFSLPRFISEQPLADLSSAKSNQHHEGVKHTEAASSNPSFARMHTLHNPMHIDEQTKSKYGAAQGRPEQMYQVRFNSPRASYISNPLTPPPFRTPFHP